jgi:hypothetical protein
MINLRSSDVCAKVGVTPDHPGDTEKLGVALETLHLQPLNGLRHPREGGTCGWYIWGGTTLRQESDFFEPLHVAHLVERCPLAIPFLGLPPGWRFLVADGQEDIWYDASLLAAREQ